MISVIVPTFNEEKTIVESIMRLKQMRGTCEIIVVDGGSTDKTVERAEPHAKVIRSDKGRANQMNAGAKASMGDVLWFVHSDSRVDEESLNHIQSACLSGVDAGCFSLSFYDYDASFMKALAFTSNLRAKYLKLMFGDQGIFVRKAVFDRLNGFKTIPIMEDWDLSKRLYACCSVRILSSKIGTSGRRFEEGGALRTLLKMHWIKWKYVRGMPPEELIEYYREIR